MIVFTLPDTDDDLTPIFYKFPLIQHVGTILGNLDESKKLITVSVQWRYRVGQVRTPYGESVSVRYRVVLECITNLPSTHWTRQKLYIFDKPTSYKWLNNQNQTTEFKWTTTPPAPSLVELQSAGSPGKTISCSTVWIWIWMISISCVWARQNHLYRLQT